MGVWIGMVLFIVSSSVALLPTLEATDESTKSIQLQRCVRQGDVISPKMFTNALEDVFKLLDWDGFGININGEYNTHLYFADNIVIMAESLENINTMLRDLGNVSQQCYNVGGRLVTVFTPVDENGYLKLSVIPQYAQFLKGGGVDGVIVAATTGEGPSINETDNKNLLDAWMDIAPSLNLFVISSVGSTPLPFTLEMTKYSEKIGVDAIFYLPEIYFRPSCAKELVDDMLLVAEAAPNTPIVYDDIPALTRVEVDIVEFFDLATEKIPTFKGVKSDEFENLLLLRNKPTGDQKIYAGNYFYLAPIVFLQFKDIVLKEFNVFPDLIIDILESGAKGNMNQTINLYQKLVDLIEVITENGKRTCDDASSEESTCELTIRSRIAIQKALKAAMPMITGIDVGPVLRPIVPYSNEQELNLQRRLRDANITIVKSYTINED